MDSAPTLVIFDCDGVLVDSEPLAEESLMIAARDLGLELTRTQIRDDFRGRSWKQVIAALEDMTGAPIPQGWEAARTERDYALFRQSLTPIDGISSVLDILDASGKAYCVASSGTPEKMSVTLGVTGLLPRVEKVIFSSVMVEHGKPAPDLFLHAARTMGHPPGTCAVVEDSVPGIMAARAAGMRALAYAGSDSADRIGLSQAGGELFSHMSELPGLLHLA